MLEPAPPQPTTATAGSPRLVPIAFMISSVLLPSGDIPLASASCWRVERRPSARVPTPVNSSNKRRLCPRKHLQAAALEVRVLLELVHVLGVEGRVARAVRDRLGH